MKSQSAARGHFRNQLSTLYQPLSTSFSVGLRLTRPLTLTFRCISLTLFFVAFPVMYNHGVGPEISPDVLALQLFKVSPDGKLLKKVRPLRKSGTFPSSCLLSLSILQLQKEHSWKKLRLANLRSVLFVGSVEAITPLAVRYLAVNSQVASSFSKIAIIHQFLRRIRKAGPCPPDACYFTF
jgi:hypothetical protein